MSIESRIIAWVLSVATAVVFGWFAHRGHRNRFAWSLAGWALGLVIATIALGLAEASFTPISPNGYFALRVKSTIVASLLIVGVGALFARARSRT
jgi:hypothetical protein